MLGFHPLAGAPLAGLRRRRTASTPTPDIDVVARLVGQLTAAVPLGAVAQARSVALVGDVDAAIDLGDV